MSGHSEPGLVQGRPLLDWLDDAFAAWDWHLSPGCLGPGVPARISTPTRLRRWLLSTSTDYPARDETWAHVVARCRSGPDVRGYRFLALGLALAGLRNYRRRIHVRSASDLPDVHADIATGFLTRLTTVTVPSPNLAGRLIDSGIGYAARRYQHSTSTPATGGVQNRDRPPNVSGIDGAGGLDPAASHVLLSEWAARARRHGARIADGDLDLIAATRLDGRSLQQAAAALGVPTEAAYKRRRRAEQRLATALGLGPGDQNGSQAEPEPPPSARQGR